MQSFTIVNGLAASLPFTNVDTDVIIRIERLTQLERSELGHFAFEALRYREDGTENPDFVLNRPPWRTASILVTGPNFGCGSSREAAVWALVGAGIRCVVASSFGEIFYDNCFQNGVLAIKLPAASTDYLMKLASDGAQFEVNLFLQQVRSGDTVVPFEVDPWRRDCLLQGRDTIELTLLERTSIAAWQAEDRLCRPWAWLSQK